MTEAVQSLYCRYMVLPKFMGTIKLTQVSAIIRFETKDHALSNHVESTPVVW